MVLDREDLANFHPIRNLAFLSKVIEHAAACQMRNYLIANDLYSSLQSAYCAFHSTETALLRVQNDLLRTIDQKKEAVMVLLDLSAAFGTIDHSILINRLREQFNILQYRQNIGSVTFDKYIRFVLPISNFKVLRPNFKIQ